MKSELEEISVLTKTNELKMVRQRGRMDEVHEERHRLTIRDTIRWLRDEGSLERLDEILLSPSLMRRETTGGRSLLRLLQTVTQNIWLSARVSIPPGAAPMIEDVKTVMAVTCAAPDQSNKCSYP